MQLPDEEEPGNGQVPRMRRWDVFFGSHFLGAVPAKDEASVLEAAYLAFGQHLRGAWVVKERSF